MVFRTFRTGTGLYRTTVYIGLKTRRLGKYPSHLLSKTWSPSVISTPRSYDSENFGRGLLSPICNYTIYIGDF